MSVRLSRSTAPGQSIPLIALLIVVLFAMVGLSVDVGNTYAQQRNTVRGTNAAALAGMTALIQNSSDQAIGKIIQESLRSNQIEGVYNDPNNLAQPNQRTIRAYYMDAKGNYLVACNIGSCGSIPGGTTYIEVQVSGTVDTYFARVVDRPTLPVSAQAFAGRCTPTQGVYPIGIQVSNLDSTATNFQEPTDPAQQPYFGQYYPASHPTGISKRRIYVKDGFDGPGQFGWLRWRAANNAGNATELAAMLQGDGNIAEGFDEGIFNSGTGTFTWPDDQNTPPMVNGIVVYPVKPHEINAGDYVYGNTGVSFGKPEIQAALKSHIDKQTVLILPLVDVHVKKSGDTVFPVQGLGAFYLIGIPGYGTGVNENAGGANSFFDLAYIGTANAVACLSTPAVVSNALGITGSVFVKPRWGLQQAQKPIAYEMIMDVSGSMSWNFEGKGSTGGSGPQFEADTTGTVTNKQCESTAANPVNVACGGGPSDPWWKVTERRIYVLKQALAGPSGFVENMKPNDQMRIITFTGGSINKGPGWSSDKTALKNTVMNAGKYNNDRYRTSGGTPGPQALKAAAEVLDTEPPPVPTNGDTYKHVVIYMTDGVANVFMNGVTNTAFDVCPQYNKDSRAINDAWCQYDKQEYPKNANGARPISAMILKAAEIKANHPEMQLFTIAVAQVNPLGLDEVATSPRYLYLATDASLVNTVLDQIYEKVIGPCAETGSGLWIGDMQDTHRADSPPMPSMPAGIYGYAYIVTSPGNIPVNIPWSGPGADPRGGVTNMVPIVTDLNDNLTYSIPPANGLSAGTYRVSGYVNYKATNASPTVGGDGKSRQYSRMMKDGFETPVTFEIKPSEVLGSSVVVDPLRFDLNENVNLCQ